MQETTVRHNYNILLGARSQPLPGVFRTCLYGVWCWSPFPFLYNTRIATGITRQITRLLQLGKSNDRAALLHLGLKSQECGVDSPADRRRDKQFDVVVVREFVLELLALLLTERSEERIRQAVVGSAEVVEALGWLVALQREPWLAYRTLRLKAGWVALTD